MSEVSKYGDENETEVVNGLEYQRMFNYPKVTHRSGMWKRLRFLLRNR